MKPIRNSFASFFMVVLHSFTWTLSLHAQNNSIRGEVADEQGNPLSFSTVALMNPEDSTLAHFGITDTKGIFTITQIPSGNYLLQVAFMGYASFYRPLKIPAPQGENLGVIALQPKSVQLGEVQVTGERIPILIKSDTVEYNAAAFRTKPDAVAEDLLRKLPGVEVDRSGNIKAMGEDVNRVLVDGKEFFSNDPKVATKNLPAESINKVQVYDKKTDEAELLGIDDSEYDKTINFVLKEDSKQNLFGDVQAGGGYGDREYYQSKARLYRFTGKHQFAALGMLNNINRPGFTFQDYLDFNGGFRNAMSGGGGSIVISQGDGLPMDFGQEQKGQVTSGAAGINYSYELKKDNRINLSYMGNGSRKELMENAFSRNFTSDKYFEQFSREDGSGSDLNNLLNVGWRNKSNSRQYSMINAIMGMQGSNSKSYSLASTYSDEVFENSLENHTRSERNQIRSMLESSWMKKNEGNWRLMKFSGRVRQNQNLKQSDWRNLMQLANQNNPFEEAQYSDDLNTTLGYSGSFTAMRKTGTGSFLEPSFTAGFDGELLNREQAWNEVPVREIDSLSPDLQLSYPWIKPGIAWKKYRKKSKLIVSLDYEGGLRKVQLNDSVNRSIRISSFQPRFLWEYEFRTGRRWVMEYFTENILPVSSRLLPIISNRNLLQVMYGNMDLRPEYKHNLFFSWFFYDQFSFTSFFANLRASYTKDKIQQSITVGENLLQTIRLVNVPKDYSLSGHVDFSTPLRFLGVNIHAGANERWNRGISYVNGQMNYTTNMNHRFNLRFDNRKKDKWDAEVGAELSLSNARYSIQQFLNQDYYSYSAFGEIRYTPSDHWNFRFSTDITRYASRGFRKSVDVPLMSAEINYTFLENHRGMLTVESSDLLNRNTGIYRFSERNSLQEIHSSVIGRFFLISFKYKLNRSSPESGGIQIRQLR